MKQKKIFYYGLPVLGTVLLLWYIKAATCNIVYTDYIRLVNSYLPDVTNPAKFFVPDVLTRIPVHYLGRIVNVMFFDYSTTFDMVLGVLGLGLSGLVLADYCKKQNLGTGWYLLFVLILFGLNKWEMLTNGTGWGHFLAFAGFYYHYIVFDRVLSGREKPRDKVRLLALPAVITLGIAGPYCAVYSAVMLLFYAAAAWTQVQEQKRDPGRQKNLADMHQVAGQVRYWIFCSISVLVPFLLYLWSNSYAVEDHAGAVDLTLGEALAGSPGFFPRFLLKSLASMVVGGETIAKWLKKCAEAGNAMDSRIYLMGIAVAAAYLLAWYLNWKYKLYKRTILPLMLIMAGMGNHGIVLISRFIFLDENYGMSSRYALQYQAGILGIVLTIGLLWRQIYTMAGKVLAGAFCVLLLAGHGYTNYVECTMAPHREDYVERIAALALRFEEVDDDMLSEHFDYRRGWPESGPRIRQALTILKENGWNVFSR